MKNARTTVLGLALVGLACQKGHPSGETTAEAHAALVQRGERLVRIGGCSDCHTPMAFDPKLKMPVPQRERFLSGHPEHAPDPSVKPGATDQAVIGPTFTSFAAPFGVVYARNLTPDRETGLGTWTEADFIKTVRTGHQKGNGRPLLPPMPWQNLAGQSAEDLRAIFAYLQSIPAVSNRVPDPQVPAPVIAAIGASFPKPSATGVN